MERQAEECVNANLPCFHLVAIRSLGWFCEVNRAAKMQKRLLYFRKGEKEKGTIKRNNTEMKRKTKSKTKTDKKRMRKKKNETRWRK